MLVLSRKVNESIIIGDIVITVVDIRGDKVRLGIDADKKISIHRGEVTDWDPDAGPVSAHTKSPTEPESRAV